MVMQGHVCGDVFDMCWAHRQSSGVARAAALQQEQPAADLPCAGGHHFFAQCAEPARRRCLTREETGWRLFLVYVNQLCVFLLLSVRDSPS